MKCFSFDLNQTIKVSLFGKEHLIPPRTHITRNTPSCILYFITQGELALEVNGKQEHLVPGDVYIFQKDDMQKPVAATDVRYYYVHFVWDGESGEMTAPQYNQSVTQKDVAFAKANKHSVECYVDLKAILWQKIHIQNRESFDWLMKQFESCTNAFWSKTRENRYWVSTTFAQILLKLESSCGSCDESGFYRRTGIYDTVMEISEYISRNFAQDIGRSEIEKKFLVNYDYTNRNFKRIMGQSIVQYRNYLRIEYAKLLLATTEKSIADIAEEIGFGDKYYFVRFFRKLEGHSPADYKKRANYNDL